VLVTKSGWSIWASVATGLPLEPSNRRIDAYRPISEACRYVLVFDRFA
jgi:hypothetical protein